MGNTVFLVLRRMRAPLIVLVVIYSVSILGLTLIPGVDSEGRRSAGLSIFHAFYVISYTATTIGFGEIPVAFSEAQRLWVIGCIYLTVVGWSYFILVLLGLLQDVGFRNAVAGNRFGRRVRLLHEPFHLVCGCGETGILICRTLDRLGRRFVIIEKSQPRVAELRLSDFRSDPPILIGDARLPANLLLAGLQHERCCGVLALTNDEGANLGVAIAARLCRSEYPVLARASSPIIVANLASFGTDFVIDAFERFAEHLSLAVIAPDRFRLVELLTSLPGSPLPDPHRPPRGRWIICGYGRFGRAVVRHLVPLGIDVTVVDPVATPSDGVRFVVGLGTEAGTLTEAGIARAEGLVAGADDDVNNLSIAMTAKELNPDVFVVTRQNEAGNGVLFDAFGPDFSLVPSRIVAEQCVAILTTPMLNRFLKLVRKQSETWCAELSGRMQVLGKGLVPEIWGQCLADDDALAVRDALAAGRPISLADLLGDSADRERRLKIEPLLLVRAEEGLLLPAPEVFLEENDHILFAGRPGARRRMELTLQNANALEYVLSGREGGGGYLWQRWANRSDRSEGRE